MLGFPNLRLLVRKAIALDHLSEYSLKDFEEDLAYAQTHPGQPKDDYNNYAPVTDAVTLRLIGVFVTFSLACLRLHERRDLGNWLQRT
jgi:hypothetical protein